MVVAWTAGVAAVQRLAVAKGFVQIKSTPQPMNTKKARQNRAIDFEIGLRGGATITECKNLTHASRCRGASTKIALHFALVGIHGSMTRCLLQGGGRTSRREYFAVGYFAFQIRAKSPT